MKKYLTLTLVVSMLVVLSGCAKEEVRDPVEVGDKTIIFEETQDGMEAETTDLEGMEADTTDLEGVEADTTEEAVATEEETVTTETEVTEEVTTDAEGTVTTETVTTETEVTETPVQ